jgi:cold shock CspA family protein/predicted type IV restriction endonuclease/energy-coupling factor transporter ATP-binding protein EcfA2
MTVDSAYELAKNILADVQSRIETIRSEEDAKVQIITRLLTEVLGWAHGDISSESTNENGYSDYLVADGDHRAFVLEAKKIGEIELGTSSRSQGTYKISGPVLKPALPGISQAASYCHPLGIPLAVLSDGLRWIVFLPWVPQATYTEKQAIVFPTVDSVLDNFALFYELIAKEEVRKNTYRVVFDRIHESRLVVDRILTAPIESADNSIIQKSALAFDLEKIFSSFFASLTGENDPDMIIDCFVETKESRIADFSLERITKNVLGNIGINERDVDEGLKAIIRDAVAGEPGQTVFIVGPSGAGKSTFLDRFFKRTLTPEVRERCVVIDVNALDASGDEAVALPWMTERAISSIEAQLFPSGYPKWNDLLGLYHTEYVKRSEGVDALLYSRDKNAFREKFAGYVEEQVERDRENYLHRLLADVVKNRKKLPVFVIDNTDEFSLPYKIGVFQYFQSLRRAVEHCLLLFPATDRSAWTFSKTDIFNIYSSRSFFLPTPSPREVFRKRVGYLKGKLLAVKDGQKGRDYFTGRGIRVSIGDLAAFAQVVESVFVDQDFSAKRVGELANYNMRKALGLSKRIITSSVLKIDDLVRSYLIGTMAAPSPERFMNALLKGDYEFFRPGDEPLIFSLFQVDSSIKQSPLIHIRILFLLHDMYHASSEESDRYISVKSLSAYFGVMLVSEVAMQRSLEALLNGGLIEPYDLSKRGYSDDQQIAISQSGINHLEMGQFNPVYFEQMALTTRIPNSEIASSIRVAYKSQKILNVRLSEIRDIFCNYLIEEDSRHCRVPETKEYRQQIGVTLELSRQWQATSASATDMLRAPAIAAEKARGTIERFDQSRGFGFVEISSLRDTAFLHVSTLERDNMGGVHDGDEIICDIDRNFKGLVVSHVHEVSRAEGPLLSAHVLKFFDERGYGFVHVAEKGVDAFFHFHLLSREQKADLYEGKELKVEIKTDKQGRSQIRRILA